VKRIARLTSCVGIVLAVVMSGTACGRDAGRAPSAPLADDSAAAIDKAITTVTTFNTELQPHIWDGAQLRPEVRKATLEIVDRIARESGIDGLKVDDVNLVGSIASYEYNDTSDFDVHVFVHTDSTALQQLSASTRLLNSNIEQLQEGHIHFYGLPVEVHFFAEGPEAERVPGIGRYSILNNAWLEKPLQQPENFDRAQMAADMKGFIDRYNKVVAEFSAAKKGFDCTRLRDLDDEITGYRKSSFETDQGPRNTQNLAFRALRRLNVSIPDMLDSLEEDCIYVNESLP
jgi:predicted nucleotidyltransferase